jgi:HSP20 family molecular chaperone IbpA
MKIISAISLFISINSFVALLPADPLDRYDRPAYQPLPPYAIQYQDYGRIWVEKDMNQDGYQLRIHTRGDVSPESIQVSVIGRTILIENKQSFQQEERTDRGYYSYSRSSSNFRRRFSIPRNADVENMARTDEKGTITITFPYLSRYPEQP